MMDRYPWIQFYPNDWLADPRLSMCSATTRGIWMDLICIMHKLDRCGQITGTLEQIARTCRCTVVELEVAIAELSQTNAADVTFSNDSVTIINRRMKKEVSGRERVRKYRRKCGNVTQKKRLSNKTVLHNSTEDIIHNKNKSVNTLVQKPEMNLFEKFWKLYDKKINRTKCEKKWGRLKQSEREEIINTLPRYIQSTPNKQYRKHPLTYLNNEGWKDAIIEDKNKDILNPVKEWLKNEMENYATG